MSTNLEYRERKRQKKRESRQPGSKAQWENWEQQRTRVTEKKGYIFVGRTTCKFCNSGEKMRNAAGHQGENGRQWKKSEQEHVHYFLHEMCNRKVSHCSRAKQRQSNVQKKCAARATLLFC